MKTVIFVRWTAEGWRATSIHHRSLNLIIRYRLYFLHRVLYLLRTATYVYIFTHWNTLWTLGAFKLPNTNTTLIFQLYITVIYNMNIIN